MEQLAADVETQAQNRQAAKDVAASRDVPGVLAAQSQLSGAYSEGYMRQLASRHSLTTLYIFMPLFITGMLGVVIADDAYSFMIFWELMSVASYFLVTFEHEQEANRKAGFLYLLMAHLGGLLILGSFAVLYKTGGSFEFDVLHSASLTPGWASLSLLPYNTRVGDRTYDLSHERPQF